MADYTAGDYMGQDSAEYWTLQILKRLKDIKDLVSGLTHIDVSVSDTVPDTSPASPENTVYIVLVTNTDTSNDLYTEYIWADSIKAWERVGTASVDLTDYAKKTEIGNATLTIKHGDTIVGTFTANATEDGTVTIPETDLSDYVQKTEIGNATLTIKHGGTIVGTFTANATEDGTVTIPETDLSDYVQKTEIGNATLTIKQGSTTLGTFTANSVEDEIINIPSSSTTEIWNDGDAVVHDKDTKSAVEVESIVNGSLHFTVDTGDLYLDSGDKRIKISDWITLSTDADRLALESPLEGKLYLVESTHCLWSYKDGWWSLLSDGDLQTRNILVSTYPVALTNMVTIPDAATNNWMAHATMFQVTEKAYLTNSLTFKAIVTQVPSGTENPVYVRPAVYQYLGQKDEQGVPKCSLVCSGEQVQITRTGWYEFAFSTRNTLYIEPTGIYFLVYLHNGNGLGMPGTWCTQMNDPPYVSFVNHNIGDLTDQPAPDSILMQSESTIRLYGSMYASGVGDT